MNLVNEEYDGSQCQIEFCDVAGHSVFSGVGFNGHFVAIFQKINVGHRITDTHFKSEK